MRSRIGYRGDGMRSMGWNPMCGVGGMGSADDDEGGNWYDDIDWNALTQTLVSGGVALAQTYSPNAQQTLQTQAASAAAAAAAAARAQSSTATANSTMSTNTMILLLAAGGAALYLMTRNQDRGRRSEREN